MPLLKAEDIDNEIKEESNAEGIETWPKLLIM